MLEAFAHTTGQVIDLKQVGYLFLLSTEEEVSQFRRNVAKQHAHGVYTEVWSAEQIAARVPLLSMEGIIAGTYYGRDGLADPSGVVNGYVTAAKALGVHAHAGVAVTGLRVQAGAITAVETTEGVIATGLVVNAAGPWAAKIGAMAGVRLPIQPERQQCLVTTALPQLPDDFPFVIDFHQRLYFHREGAGLLTGMGIVNAPFSDDTSVDPDHTLTHMERAMARLPILETAGKLTEWAGLYEVTPDAHPIIDAVTEVRGLHVVAGFSGHGFMHGPIAGLLVAEQIVDGAAHTVDISALSYERFADAKLPREFNVV
jgi:sarcosine oxidase, subunit beta